MQHLCKLPLRGHRTFILLPLACQGQVRFFALIELSHILHRLCRPPSISLSLILRPYFPGGTFNALASPQRGSNPLTANVHRLQLGLPGYLILFDPLAFVPQCQESSRDSLSPLVFLSISTHFTATPRIPVSPPTLEQESIQCRFRVEPGDFTSNFSRHLRTLYAQ